MLLRLSCSLALILHFVLVHIGSSISLFRRLAVPNPDPNPNPNPNLNPNPNPNLGFGVTNLMLYSD